MTKHERRPAPEGGEAMGRKTQKPQANMFRCKRHRAPFRPMKRGFFMPDRREFRRKNQKRKD